jgi:flagellar FliJ protein
MNKNFKLQKVLEYRENILKLEEKKLIEIQTELKKMELKREGLIGEIKTKEDELTILKDKGDFQFIQMYENFLEKLKSELKTLNSQINNMKNLLEKQKKRVLTALNEKKIMESLKNKHLENYREFLKKEELKMIDELVITRFKGAKNEYL